MKILMLGGTALTGPHVIRQMVQHDITTLSRSQTQVACERAIKGDREIVSNIERALIASDPDVVIDMIPFTTKGATALVDAYAEFGRSVPTVALSSMDVYAGFGRLHQTEDTPHQVTPMKEDADLRLKPGPQGDAYDKTGVEQIYRGHLSDLTLLRMPVIYGWPDATRIESYFKPMLEGAKDIVIAKDLQNFRISRTLHKNAAHAVKLAAEAHPLGQQVFNVCEQETYSERQWADRIARLCGWHGNIVDGPNHWAHAPDQDLIGDSTALRDALGYCEPFDPEDGLRDCLAFFAAQHSGREYVKGY